jgi:hypothetical protein
MAIRFVVEAVSLYCRLPSQDDGCRREKAYKFPYSYSDGQSRKDDVIYMGRMRYSSQLIDDISRLKAVEVVKKKRLAALPIGSAISSGEGI